MIKEIKYLIYIFIICLFLFFTGKYYFSDINKKNSYRSLNNLDEKINIYAENIPIMSMNIKYLISLSITSFQELKLLRYPFQI